MDQASTLPRFRRVRPSHPFETGPAPSAIATRAQPTAPSTVEHPGSEPPADPGEDPESPGGNSSSLPRALEADATGDPLAEPIAALLGAALAVVTLLVPLLVVLTLPSEHSDHSRFRRLPNPAYSRSRSVDTVTDSAARVAP
jgi:hypothetical protein